MKKTISILLALVICLTMCACNSNSNNNSNKKTLSDRATAAVENYVWSYVYVTYGQPQNIVVNTTSITQSSDNIFQASGKVTVTDKYGDKFTGKYDATAIYDSVTDDFDVEYNVGTLYG